MGDFIEDKMAGLPNGFVVGMADFNGIQDAPSKIDALFLKRTMNGYGSHSIYANVKQTVDTCNTL